MTSYSPSLLWVKLSVYLLLAVVVCASLGIVWSKYDSRSLTLNQLRSNYALPKSEFISLAGHDIHVVDEGSGPVLVLLHGNANSLWIWNDWATQFVARGYRVIRFDLPSYGLSEAVHNGQLGIAATYEVLASLLEYKKVVRSVLIGTANGGPPAAWYAANHPDRVAGLVLINTPFYPAEGDTGVLGRERWAREHIYPLTGRPWLADWLYVRDLAGKGQSVDPEFVSHIHDIDRRADIASSLNSYGSSFSFPELKWNPEGLSNQAMLGQLKLPTLIMWGERSLLPVSEADRLAGLLQSADVNVVKYGDGGHWLPIYDPTRTGGDVLKFLGSIE